MIRISRVLAAAALLLVSVPAGAIDDHLTCYRVTDDVRLDATVNLASPQFGLESGCRVSRTKHLCVPSQKDLLTALDKATGATITPLPFTGVPQVGDVLCYRLKCPPRLVPLGDQEVTDQFGTRVMRALRTVMLCTPAVKGSAFCGDGTVGAGEQCEGIDLGGATCQSLGFASGSLACAPECRFDTNGCTPNLPSTCGNGTIDAPESCDGLNLGGASCQSLGYAVGGTLACTGACGYDVAGCLGQALPATGQTTCWDTAGTVVPCAGTGQDGDLTPGAPLAYLDNGDGTITDLNTKLVWEKLADDGSIHDRDDVYTWADAFAVKIAALNTPACFAGHCDWRLPTVKELQTIVNYQLQTPAVSSAFHTACAPACPVTTCSCTTPSNYWSSTTYVPSPGSAWYVFFFDGNVFSFNKTFSALVRAVRGGA